MRTAEAWAARAAAGLAAMRARLDCSHSSRSAFTALSMNAAEAERSTVESPVVCTRGRLAPDG
jgi:hypothetical protein